MKRLLAKHLTPVLLVVPLTSPEGWQVLEYKNIPANRVEFSQSGMKVEVKSSASPIIYPLPKKTAVKQVNIEAFLQGDLKIPSEKSQGEKGADDYLLRIGLVVAGEKTLNAPKSWLAPAWIKKLFSLAPPGEGIDYIYFLNVGSEKSHLGRIRQHPLSDLLKEEVVKIKNGPTLGFSHPLAKPLLVSAVWVSIDGDDSKSAFTVELQKMELVEPTD